MYGNFKIATVDVDTVALIENLENDIGKHIMALEPGLSFAQLSDDEIQKVEALEKETGVTLLVYEKPM